MAANLKLIRKQVARGLKAAGLTRPAILTKTVEGAYAAGQASGDTAKTLVLYRCRGIVSSYAEDQIDGTLITKEDRRIALVGATLGATLPSEGDSVTIDGATYRVLAVARDPASAIYTCQCRG